ncbi:Scr1 family TA system antitoxin-like transcriptional regulator [Streptomyces europaeiscabiei]|uniref:Scr1 family TA system antitoxin-like transcriptional regulator n=1 Tax=Streptomyces europaeiscabiei TaxID=146819 RepID=UPI0022788C3C|nr:Scr1 family TA system antitoxin-like transcriptional regulator [Streptomyces europaeiscabiei]MDX2773416.1 Scr1 family TA system antitoxin-like transcriptional regulator [Streptomyces europaeiscabiei]
MSSTATRWRSRASSPSPWRSCARPTRPRSRRCWRRQPLVRTTEPRPDRCFRAGLPRVLAGEAVLRRVYGGPEVMREQYEHLAEPPSVSVTDKDTEIWAYRRRCDAMRAEAGGHRETFDFLKWAARESEP